MATFPRGKATQGSKRYTKSIPKRQYRADFLKRYIFANFWAKIEGKPTYGFREGEILP